MLATVGLVVQHYSRFQGLGWGDGSAPLDPLQDTPSSFEAIGTYPASAAFGTLVLFAGIVELRFSDEGRAPGDYGDPLNLRQSLAYEITDDANLKTFELEHGRLAMLGVMGVLAAEYITGYDAVEQWEHAAEGYVRLNNLIEAAREPY